MRPLSLNCVGDDVKALQHALNQSALVSFQVGEDGHFGNQTAKAVVEFQTAKKMTVDGVAGTNTLAVLGLMAAPKMPTLLVLHESDTPVFSKAWTPERVVDLHVRINGWGRPGYSRIIAEDGRILESWRIDLSDGFQPFEVTYGVAEYNPISLNVCTMGGMTADGKGNADTRTPEQKAALQKVVFDIIGQVPTIKVCGHNQLHNKLCPGYSVPKWLRAIGIAEANIYAPDPYHYAATLNG